MWSNIYKAIQLLFSFQTYSGKCFNLQRGFQGNWVTSGNCALSRMLHFAWVHIPLSSPPWAVHTHLGRLPWGTVEQVERYQKRLTISTAKTSSNQRLWLCVRRHFNFYTADTLNNFPSWLSTSKNQPFFISSRGFTERYFSDKVHAILIEEVPVQNTLRDGASFRRLTILIGLKYLHQPSNFVLNIFTLTCKMVVQVYSRDAWLALFISRETWIWEIIIQLHFAEYK